jgi:hypothetical protein
MQHSGCQHLLISGWLHAFVNETYCIHNTVHCLQVRNQVTTLPVHLDQQQQDYSAALDAAAEAARLAGHPVCALMFTHPANPQGTLFSRQQLASMVQWCLRNRVHCIRWADECVVLSVFGVAVCIVAVKVLICVVLQGALHQVGASTAAVCGVVFLVLYATGALLCVWCFYLW